MNEPSESELLHLSEPTRQGDLGEALVEEIRDSLRTLSALLPHAGKLGEPVMATIRSTGEEVERRLSRRHVSVVVIGERQSGKSTFLNAILGERLLGTATREGTGTVTFIRRSATLDYRAVLLDGSVQEFSRRMPDQSAHFSSALEAAQKETETLVEARSQIERSVAEATQRLARQEVALAEADWALEAARDESGRASTRCPGAGARGGEGQARRRDRRRGESDRLGPARRGAEGRGAFGLRTDERHALGAPRGARRRRHRHRAGAEASRHAARGVGRSQRGAAPPVQERRPGPH